MTRGAPAVVVVGRYAGVVGVLTDLLAAAGVDVGTGAAGDTDGIDAVRDALCDADVVVLTAAPGDPTAAVALHAATGRDPATVVAVTWHPDDELVPLPAGVRRVRAGRIRTGLPVAVADAVAASRQARGCSVEGHLEA